MALVDKNAADAHAWLLLGQIKEKKGDFDQAAVDYRQAMAFKDPAAEGAMKHIDELRVQSSMQDADKAISEKNLVGAAQILREASGIAPSVAAVHKKLAEVLKQMGDTTESDKEQKKYNDLAK